MPVAICLDHFGQHGSSRVGGKFAADFGFATAQPKLQTSQAHHDAEGCNGKLRCASHGDCSSV